MALDMDTLCRSCMAENESMIPIFQPCEVDGALSIADLFNSFTTIEASEDDALPKNICSLCFAEIQRTIAFKDKTESCDIQFKQYLQIIGHQNNIPLVSEPHDALVEQVKRELEPVQPCKSKEIVIKMELNPLTSEMRFVDDSSNHFEAADDYTNDEPLEDSHDDKTIIMSGSKAKTETGVNNTICKNKLSPMTTNDTYQQPVECPHCKTRFCSFNSLQKHNRNQVCVLARLRHDPKTPVNCTNCGEEFTKINCFRRHINLRECRKKLKKVRQYHCAHCTAVFTRREKITRHLVTHGFLLKYPCVYCRQEYDKSYMREHIRLMHTPTLELEHLCQVCGKAFSLRNTLRLHMMRHDANKAFKCNVCPFTCVTKGELRSHSHKHTGEHPFECSVCDHRSTTHWARSRHMRIHTGEKNYACDFCPMRFAVPFTLKNHRRTHTGEKPYACDKCDRTFTQRSDCVSHQKTHIVGYLFKCKHCPLSFERHSALKVHTKTHSQSK